MKRAYTNGILLDGTEIWRATASPAQSRGTMLRWCAKF